MTTVAGEMGRRPAGRIESGRRTMTIDQAIVYLRSRPEYTELVHNAYLGTDLVEASDRFEQGAEFEAVLRLLSPTVGGGDILDLGAGNGIATRAFRRQGAARVFAVEPDPSDEVGAGALHRLVGGDDQVEIVQATGENLPLPDQSVDVVYVRQVLHHTQDLPQVLRECARVLRPGGRFLACREHVVDSEADLKTFLAGHPVHRLTGGENAYHLDEYTGAIVGSGLDLVHAFGPWETIINAFPAVATETDLRELPTTLLRRRFGDSAARLGRIGLVERAIWSWLDRPLPGRLYTFFAVKR